MLIIAVVELCWQWQGFPIRPVGIIIGRVDVLSFPGSGIIYLSIYLSI